MISLRKRSPPPEGQQGAVLPIAPRETGTRFHLQSRLAHDIPNCTSPPARDISCRMRLRRRRARIQARDSASDLNKCLWGLATHGVPVGRAVLRTPQPDLAIRRPARCGNALHIPRLRAETAGGNGDLVLLADGLRHPVGSREIALNNAGHTTNSDGSRFAGRCQRRQRNDYHKSKTK